MAKKSILFDEISTSNSLVSKILEKKRIGILKNPSILEDEKNQDPMEDLFSEQLFLLNLNKQETNSRVKTLRAFHRNFYYGIDEYPKKQSPNLLKKQASLKEILISSKKLKISLEDKKMKKEPYVISELWSDKYYRCLLKHSKLDNLIKETEKEKIWRFVKAKSMSHDKFAHKVSDNPSLKTISPIKPCHKEDFFSKKDESFLKFPRVKNNNMAESENNNEGALNSSKNKKKLKRKYNSVDSKKFYITASTSIINIIKACDRNDPEKKYWICLFIIKFSFNSY